MTVTKKNVQISEENAIVPPLKEIRSVTPQLENIKDLLFNPQCDPPIGEH